MKKNLRFVLALAIGWLTSVGAMAIEPVDGVYQIGSAQDWAEFCTLHNEGTNQRLNAVLTADVTVDGNAMVGINGGGKPYRGSFDGQGHKLIVSYNLDEERVAPFRRINGATIKNLIVEGSITTKSKLASGLVGGLWQSGTKIQNCASYVTINDEEGGDATHGGLCGSFEDVNGANVIENCAFFGAINAPNREGCGGLVGWTNQSNNTNIIRNCLVAATLNVKKESNNDIICRNNAIVINCYYLGSIDGLKNDKGAVAATDAQAQSGELCYLLNEKQSETPAWFQKIGTDAKPTAVGTDIVYANGELKCDGITPKEGSSLSFSNTANSTVDEHSFVDGICTVCSALQEIEGFYQIGCAAALNRYSEIVRTTNGGAKAVLTKDIDMTDQVWTPIGQDGHDFQGHFNGQGHRIKNLKTDANNNNQALFGQAIGGTIIENVIIDASCVIKGGSRTAGILSQVWGDNVIIRNCGNEANIEGSQENCAGIVGCSQGKVIHISNCYNTGSITGNRENAGICAWMGSDNSTISNCYSTATNVNGEALWRKGEVKGENMFQIEGKQGTAFTAADLASGKLAYMLNGNKSTDVVWYQVIGTDANPVPCAKEGGVVYANGELDCAGNAKAGSEETYSNTEGATRDEHQFADGFCTACGAFDANYIAETDGAYNLASAKDVKWFAALVNSGSGNANARLTADVDFADVTFTGIGNGSNHFTGTFDGQGHIVKNMVIDQPEESNIGFFNEIDNGAVIKNFTIDASCSVKGKAFTGAFVGHVSGNGTALLECLGNEGTVETVNQNAGALVGCNTSGELKITAKNCYNAGAIKSGNEAGGLSGWFGNDAITVNCYNMGTVTNGESYARGNNIQLTNCFDPVVNWPAITHVNMEDFTNGVVYAKLSEAAPTVWYLSAAEGGHPVLYKTQWGGPANAAIANAEAFEGHTTNALKQALADAINAAKLAVASGDDDAIAAKLGDMNTALAAAKALDITVLEQTMALAEEGVDLTDANDFIANGTTADELNNVLYRLRTARKINALTTIDIYQGSAPKAGKVYIYNVGTGLFLGTGSNWNTHAAVDQVGIEIELVDLDKPETNNFKFKTGRGDGWMAYNGYVDTRAQDIWHFLPVDGKEGVYNISSTGNDGFLLGYDPNAAVDGILYWNNIAIDRTGLDNPMNQWKVITAEERAALLKAASEENPVDVSYLIKNASLNRQDGYDDWTKAYDGGNGGARVSSQTYNNNGDCAADYAWEYYNPNTFSFTQNLTGLKAGNYMVMVQGFFRNGDGKAQADAVNNEETLVQLPYLVANQQQALLPNIADEAGLVPGIADMMSTAKGDFPNMPASALEFFEHGAYWTVVEVEVGTDGLLTIGVKKDEKQLDGDWTVFDNFRLIYLGNPALEAAKSDLATLILTAKGLDTIGKTEESVSALNTAIGNAETALAAEDATVESLTTAKTNLQTAINNLADIVNGINAIESAAQAGKAFNMQGQQVKKAQKGVYIINNKKVVVK
ncbi:FIVAR domain-containing protein [Xylanibacter brevis]|uniref:FIVAR domain-containing protein n=1 Tax=Xylanibacter brevis TaxID=83231 RepID=UPI000484D0B0|nr:FIVAR domain-containing protein [Xylanibacter brevis]